MGKKAKKSDLCAKTVEDLKRCVIELKRELLNLRFQKSSNELKGTHRFREVRREIARVKTASSLKQKSNME